MMLKIEADTGKLDAKLAQSEAAVKRLEASVKIGDRTMKANVTTEAQLTAALQKWEGAAIKATEAGKRRAAASLAAQRSSAMYTAFLKKEAEAERAAAAEKTRAASLARQKSTALLKEMEAQERATAATKRAAKAEEEKRAAISGGFAETLRRAVNDADEANFKRRMKNQADLQRSQEAQNLTWKRGTTAALGMVGGMVGVGAAAAAAMTALRLLTSAHEHQMEVARRSDQAATGLKEFIALQAEGEEGKAHVQATVLKGAEAGVGAGEVGQLAQPIQSVVDSDGDGKLNPGEKAKFDEDFGAALRLKQIGVEAKDAATVITGNRTKGIGGAAAADKLIAAADKSVGGPADFARAASAINQFEDSDTGLAAATALTAEGTPLEQLPTLVRGAALTLGSANDESDFSKKFGLAGLSEAEKVAKLREEGDRRGTGATRDERIADFSRSFKSKEGGALDEEKARAMGLLVRQGELFESTREAVGGEAVAGLTEKKVKALQEDPLAGSAMRSDAAKAQGEVTALYGPESEAARAEQAERQGRGAILRKYGGEQAVDAEGSAKSVLDAPWDVMVGYLKAMANGMTIKGGADPNSPSGDQDVAGSMAALTQALQENTEVTRQNSTSTKAKAPVGGAASNAEEKY